MGAPATQGRLCTRLEEMEIGDYIRCTYTATEANVAGEFSDLGGFVDSYETEQQQVDTEGNVIVDADGNPVMEKVTKRYEEIPIFGYVPSATIPIRGYFYLLKANKGLMIADRCVQNFISATSLNAKNYLHGVRAGDVLVRVLSQAEWTKYLTNGDLNGCIVKQAENVWHVKNYGIYYDRGYPVGTSNYYHLLEILSDTKFGKIRVAMNIDGSSRSATVHTEARVLGGSQSTIGYIEKFLEQNANSHFAQAAYPVHNNRFCNVYSNIMFRPTIEYIDSKNSKTIYW